MMNLFDIFLIVVLAYYIVKVYRRAHRKSEEVPPMWPEAMRIMVKIGKAQTVGDLEDIGPLLDRFEILYGSRECYGETLAEIVLLYNRRMDAITEPEYSSEHIEIPTLYRNEKRKQA